MRCCTPGLKGRYEYDFGTPPELKIEVVGEREGKPLTTKPLTCWRNVMPAYECADCGEPATHLHAVLFRAGEPGRYLRPRTPKTRAHLYGGPKALQLARARALPFNGPAKPPY